MSLKALEPFVGGIKFKTDTSSLSGYGSSLKAVFFLFGLPLSASAVSKPIFDIKATEDKNKISTPMLSESGKNVLYFGSMASIASPKSAAVVLLLIPAQMYQYVLSLYH